MKTQIDTVNATPSKRLFFSIIADYDINMAICELVDNALDQWIVNKHKNICSVSVELNDIQQTITVSDDAGGVPESELSAIVGPGQTGNYPDSEIIGIFGVGTKRAVVALAQDVTITTRHNSHSRTFQIEFDDTWMNDGEWELPYYSVDNIEPETTIVRLQQLRQKITDTTRSHLISHLSEVYGDFISTGGLNIRVNDEIVSSSTFESWSYPPGFEPRQYKSSLQSGSNRPINVEVTAGLASGTSPTGGEYGVYFYCNDRLISKEIKTHDVGFASGVAGKPHPEISLVRVIVHLNGAAQDMPWNSSKSAIQTYHPTFVALQEFIINRVKELASLSRRLDGSWDTDVFPYANGEKISVHVTDIPQASKSYLPPLPRSRPRVAERIASINQGLSAQKPWVVGLYESIAATDVVLKQKRITHRNRIALIILDSTLEIGFKEYLIYDSGVRYAEKRWLDLSNDRHQVHLEVKKTKQFKDSVWKKIEYYYGLRSKLIHERSTATISDDELLDFRLTVQRVLSELFGLKFEPSEF